MQKYILVELKKIVLLGFALLLLSTAMAVRFARPVIADGTIYIRADGSIEGTTDIFSADNLTYIFTDNINDSIVVERDNIVVDGAGYTVQGPGWAYESKGINLTGRSNVTLKNVEVTNFKIGICLVASSNSTLIGNTASNNDYGIHLGISSNNVLTGNNASNNGYAGINLGSSSNNVLTGNNASNNGYAGIIPINSSNSTLIGNTASNNDVGILLGISSNSTLIGNTASNNDYFGIYLASSSNNVLAGNTASSNTYEGIRLDYSDNNTLIGNTASNNDVGIHLRDSSNNTLFHNNLIDNTFQANVTTGYVNTWDDGYPSGGNYWSDYNGTDAYYGENATGPPPDGIGDTPYTIDANNSDNYPLMGMFSDFKATSEYHVQTICNSTISDFQYNGTAICFNATGENDTTGFCRILIPRALMNETYQVFVNGTEVPCNLLPCSNTTHSYLYFTYNHSTQEVIIVPEFPTWTSTLLTLIVLSVAIAICKRRLVKTPIH